MLKRISALACNVVRIVSKRPLGFRKKLALLWVYASITLKRFFHGRAPGVLARRQRLPGGCVLNTPSYDDFYWTFLEVYLDDDYYFPSETTKPFIVNLGANIGVDEVYFKWLYPHCRILSFEALPENADVLRKNVSMNDFNGITVIEAAVGEKKGTLTLYGDRRVATVARGLIDEQVKVHEEYASKEVEVEVVPLSPFLEREKEVDLLKVDIEGAEGAVISELDRAGVLRRIKNIVIEYHRFSFEENKLSRIVDALERNRFDITFRSDFANFENMPRREYYNFMLYARRRE